MSDLIDTSTTEGQKVWAGLCQKAFENLASDTSVTFHDVDAILTLVLPEYEEITDPLRTSRAQLAEAAISSVRALHVRELDWMGRPRCAECASLCHSRSGLGCDDVDGAWPCPTIAALDGTDPVEAAPRRRLEDLGNVPIRFWVCPVPGHSEGDWRDGAPAVTVEWRGDVAYCMAPGCGRSSADPDGTHPDVPAPGRSGEEKRPCPHCGPDHEFGHGYSGLPVDGEEQTDG